MICGIIPRFLHEPPTNLFAAPLVEEVKKWNEGFKCYSSISKKKKKKMERFCVRLI